MKRFAVLLILGATFLSFGSKSLSLAQTKGLRRAAANSLPTRSVSEGCGLPSLTLRVGRLFAAARLKPLDHSCYDKWNSLSGQKISNDGHWGLYTIKPGKGDSVLHIRATSMGKTYSQARASSAQFTYDSRFVLYRVSPDPEVIKKLIKAKEKKLPKTALHILELKTGKKTIIERVRSFSLPAKMAGVVAYSLEAPDKKPAKKVEKKEPGKKEEKKVAQGKGKKSKTGVKKKTSKKKRTLGTDLVLRNLDNGKELRFPYVTSFRFTRDGKHFAFVTVGKDEKKDGVRIMRVADGKARSIISGKGEYRSVTWDRDGKGLAFLSNRDDADAKKPAWSVYFWQAPMKQAQAVVTEKTAGLPKGHWVASSSPSFSRNGKRLFFSTAERPAEPKKTKKTKPSKKSKTTKAKKTPPKINVDIWHWKDPYLQPEQLKRMRFLRFRSYRAVLHLDTHKIVPLADKDLPRVTVGADGNADVAVGASDTAYQKMTSWDYPSSRDVYLVDVNTGKRRRVMKKVQARVSLSPDAKYLTWWDPKRRTWFCRSVKTNKTINLSAKIRHPVHNELHDQPAPPSPYGSAGWLKGDRAILLYDKHDIWAVDPESKLRPVCVTEQYGRKHNMRFRYVRLDVEERAIDPEAPMLLSAVDMDSKATGYFRDRVGSTGDPEKLILRDEYMSSLQKADNSNAVIFTCSTFRKYPDVWASDLNFKELRRLSDTNPQQKDYRWGTAELVSWKSLDGLPLTGILYKPDGFNANKKHPMMVYFYERSSDRLHRYYSPKAGSSSINISFYVSRGYLVFVPDIAYQVGHPGQSCYNCVLPGVLNLVGRGFVDAKKIGVQGHSWGGYQIAYLVTRTKIFAAAEAGAPVTNMTSAYGGIRWSSGKSRMFQYEKTQSRIGGTLWNAQHRYIENSPVFWADRVHTPLLMLHNDKDGAVPWYQGIEMFVALRRLGKPTWMFNYNGENHGLIKKENRRDWAVRMQRFFDHYLKGAPAPRWLTHGVPADQKGKATATDTP